MSNAGRAHGLDMRRRALKRPLRGRTARPRGGETRRGRQPRLWSGRASLRRGGTARLWRLTGPRLSRLTLGLGQGPHTAFLVHYRKFRRQTPRNSRRMRWCRLAAALYLRVDHRNPKLPITKACMPTQTSTIIFSNSIMSSTIPHLQTGPHTRILTQCIITPTTRNRIGRGERKRVKKDKGVGYETTKRHCSCKHEESGE